MPGIRITYQPAGVTVEVDPAEYGGYPYGQGGERGSLLDIALGHGVPIEHACGGNGVCGTCHVIVTAGMDNLSPPDDDEMDVIDRAPCGTLNSRLACRAVVRGDVTITIPDWNRNVASERH